MSTDLNIIPNKLVGIVGKPAKEFTKEDIMNVVRQEGIEMIISCIPQATDA